MTCRRPAGGGTRAQPCRANGNTSLGRDNPARISQRTTAGSFKAPQLGTGLAGRVTFIARGGCERALRCMSERWRGAGRGTLVVAAKMTWLRHEESSRDSDWYHGHWDYRRQTNFETAWRQGNLNAGRRNSESLLGVSEERVPSLGDFEEETSLC